MIPAIIAGVARLAPMVARVAPTAAKVAGNGRMAAFTAGRMVASNNQQPQQPQQPQQGGYGY
jgi:hypothetical protein